MQKHRNQQGFTLIEIMVVVIILAILVAIVAPKIMNRPEQARMVKAKQDISAIENALSLYQLDNGFYPSTEQGIAALTHKPSTPPTPLNYAAGGYLKNAPTDPWGQTYHYRHPGLHGDIDIYTTDPNRKNTDGTGPLVIGNWNLSKIH